MAVLIRHRSDGMTAALYDEISPPLVEQLKTQPGFLLHVTYEDATGFVVSELWETEEQQDAWFRANVKPNLPFEVTQEVVRSTAFTSRRNPCLRGRGRRSRCGRYVRHTSP